MANYFSILIVALTFFSVPTKNEILDFIEQLPRIAPHEKYTDFDESKFIKTQGYSFPTAIIQTWEETPINNISFEENQTIPFYTNQVTCMGTYTIKEGVKTVLIRKSNGDFPYFFYLLNLIKKEGKLIPVSQLEVYSVGNTGGNLSFVVTKENQIKVYHIGEESALGTTVFIDANGQFQIESSKWYRGNDYNNITEY